MSTGTYRSNVSMSVVGCPTLLRLTLVEHTGSDHHSWECPEALSNPYTISVIEVPCRNKTSILCE